MRKEKKDFFEQMIQCPRCGKWSRKTYVQTYGTCLCGEVLDEKAKFKYEMYVKLHLWRNKNYKITNIERNKYD